MIELRGIYFNYPRRISLTEIRRRRVVFCNLNLRFQDGLNIIISPNGSGKTTLLKIIAGIIEPDRGEILFDGKQMDYVARLRQVSYIPTTAALPPRFTVRDLLKLMGWYIDERIKKLVVDILDRQLLTLSSGQYKRALIAVGISKPTHYLVMDEPFHFLDEKWRDEVVEYLENREGTIILASPSREGVKRLLSRSNLIDLNSLNKSEECINPLREV